MGSMPSRYLETGKLKLPDAQSVSALASEHPRLAAMLDGGVPAVDALARFGAQAFAERQFSIACAAFRASVALAPVNPVLWTNYGTALDCAGAFADAAACLEHSLELSRQQPDTWLLLGLVRKKHGDLYGCEAAYRVALEQRPNLGAAWQCLGLLKAEQREYTQAIECLNAALKLVGANAALAANLGKLYYEVGRIPEACDEYNHAVSLDPGNQHYRQMARKSRFILDLINHESVENSLAAYQRSLSPADSNTEKSRKELLQTAFGILSGFGHVEAAKRVGEKYLQLWPDSTVVEYLMKAVDGAPDVERSPDDYIVEYFDSFAGGFDTKLVGVLGYDVPEKICATIRELTPAGHKYDAVDLGCGTGLCGPFLRPLSAKLVGVDLSAKMLELAVRRGAYDDLKCEEVTVFLKRSRGQFDLVLAADVIVYIGDLAPIFSAAASAIRCKGLFAFSTETWTGEGYRLQPSGRFSHSLGYIRSLAQAAFVELECVETTIRLEAGARVPGHLLVFQKRAF